MGRKALHRTEYEIQEQRRLRNQRYYQRHKSRIKRRQMQRYMEKKLPEMHS